MAASRPNRAARGDSSRRLLSEARDVIPALGALGQIAAGVSLFGTRIVETLDLAVVDEQFRVITDFMEALHGTQERSYPLPTEEPEA